MSPQHDLHAHQIDLARHVLDDALTERDRCTGATPWQPGSRQPCAATEAAIDEARTIPAHFEARARPVHGFILRSNGDHHLLHEPVTWHELHLILTCTIDVAAFRHPAHPDVPLLMCLDDLHHHKGLPPNLIATALYGTGWLILGDVVLSRDDDEPLPNELVDSVVHRWAQSIDRTAWHPNPGPSWCR